jgi:protein-tyrosine-phosphatase
VPLTNSVRTFLRNLRNGLDRRLHPRRQAGAKSRLESIAPRTILFVCLGNVCRSPYAERLAAKEARVSLEVDSAGFIGPGLPPPEHAISAARATGVEHADHRSETLTPDLLEGADAVFLFDRHNARRLRRAPGIKPDRVFWLGDFDPEWEGRRAIPDPWGKPLEDFQRTFWRIRRCVDEMLRSV